jgi:transcriptional regulator with XRE-family HTH domain
MDRDELSMTVAHNIGALMTARGMDAAKLARAARINPTGVYDILSGKSRSPKIETISKIAKGLNVPVSAIFEDRARQDVERDLMNILMQLPEEQRRLLTATAQAWLAQNESA